MFGGQVGLMKREEMTHNYSFISYLMENICFIPVDGKFILVFFKAKYFVFHLKQGQNDKLGGLMTAYNKAPFSCQNNGEDYLLEIN